MRYLHLAALLLSACSDTRSASATVFSAPSALQSQPPIIVPTDSIERAAQRAIQARRPIAAEQLLKTALASQATRTPQKLLLGAEAASLRNAWPDVLSLLRDQAWIDTTAGGYGHLLLARAALEDTPRSAALDSLAAFHAERATGHADAMIRGSAQLLLARALDRARDDARAAKLYREAAASLPEIRDWLLLRAAAVTRERSARRDIFDDIRDTVAGTRVDSIDVTAMVRFGDTVIAPRAPANPSVPARATAVLRTLSDSVARARTLIRQRNSTVASRILRRVTGSRSARAAQSPQAQSPQDADATATAWYLLGDLASEQAALTAWRTLWSRYPEHPLAARGAFRGGVLAWRRGAVADAVRWWSPLAALNTTESLAARYWLARAADRRGDRTAARRAWQALVRDAPDSYYAMLAAARIDTVAWRDDAAPPLNSADSSAQRDERVSRLLLLDALGLDPEAAAVRRDLLTRDAPAPALMMAAATLRREELASPAIRLAERARNAGAPADAELYRTLFPLPFGDIIADWSRQIDIDAALVAAVIRQESRFTPTARSAADARGLMQLLPSVGRSLATGSVDRPWSVSLLYEPEINIPLGVRHLRQALRSDGGTHPAYALAAYNAGRSRLLRWRALPGASADWELFVEQIPYVETRDYVRIVLRNREWYRALYPQLRSAGNQEL